MPTARRFPSHRVYSFPNTCQICNQSTTIFLNHPTVFRCSRTSVNLDFATSQHCASTAPSPQHHKQGRNINTKPNPTNLPHQPNCPISKLPFPSFPTHSTLASFGPQLPGRCDPKCPGRRPPYKQPFSAINQTLQKNCCQLLILHVEIHCKTICQI